MPTDRVPAHLQALQGCDMILTSDGCQVAARWLPGGAHRLPSSQQVQLTGRAVRREGRVGMHC